MTARNKKEGIFMKWIRTKTYEELSAAAAELIATVVVEKPSAVLGLATGSSPIGTYNELIARYERGELDFSAVRSVNLDEYVGLDGKHEQSYRYFMDTHLFDRVNIDKNNTFVPDGLTDDPDAYGEQYDQNIVTLGGIDLQLLGIGLDGHIGFNEPADHFVAATHRETLDPSTIEANARFFASKDDVPTSAITMGMRSIMQAKKILIIGSGKKKIEVLERAFQGDVTPMLPASILQLHPDVTVITSED